MGGITEKHIESKIRDYLKSEGVWFKKIHGGPYQEPGIPDIIGCCNGRFFAFEVKRQGGKATPKQALEIREIIKSGGSAVVVTSLEEVIVIIEFLKETRISK